MISITLDTNCLIDLEQQRPAAKAVTEIVDADSRGEVTLQICAISASEGRRAQDGEPVFQDFKDWLALLGLDQCKVLAPLFYWGVTFWDYCLWGSEEMRTLDKEIHSILFPSIEYEYADFCAARGLNVSGSQLSHKWLNAKCDVLALWSHIHHGGDVFVTSDENFHKEKKLPRLLHLGAAMILRPNDAAAKVQSIINSGHASPGN